MRVTRYEPGGISTYALLLDCATVGDGIPDFWRQHYLGGGGQTTNSQSCARCDKNKIGQDNGTKHMAALNPLNPASMFDLQISKSAGSSAGYHLTYSPTYTNRTYTVQYATNMGNPVFTNLIDFAGPIPGTNQTTITDINTSQQTRFYRVRVAYP